MKEENEDEETRCYNVTGGARELEGVEEALRYVEWIGERRTRCKVTLLVDARRSEAIRVRVVGSWRERSAEESDCGARLKSATAERESGEDYSVVIGGKPRRTDSSQERFRKKLQESISNPERERIRIPSAHAAAICDERMKRRRRR